MNDPFGSMQNMMSSFSQFVKNPMQFMTQNRLRLPQNFNGSANDAIQHLMNTGQLTQEQYNWANSVSKKIQKMPSFQNFIRQ